MPVVVADDSTIAEQIRHRRPRNPPQPRPENPETDPNPARPKPTISSVLFPSSPTNDTPKKKNFTSATFRGLGCTASSQVSVPAVIRTSANWEPKKLNKKRLKTKKSGNSKLPPINSSSAAAAAAAGASTANPASSSQSSLSLALSSSCVGAPDVWCGSGMGIITDAADVDCVVSRRPARGKVDGGDRINVLAPRERNYTVRRMVIPEDSPFIGSDADWGVNRLRSGSRHHRHVRHGFREGLAEIVMLQSSNMLMGGRSYGLDRYRDLRLDVDNMSYEELLELGDRIGHVSTGLREDEITCCLRRTKLALLDDLSEIEKKCSICQEEYEADDETGKLNCGHFYHMYCITQWLGQKNACPICKTSALPQT